MMAPAPGAGPRRAAAGGLLAVFLAAAAACDGDGARRAGPSLDLGADSMGVVPDARRIATRGPRALEENSGAARSRSQPGIWFTINDSGHEPVVYALDTSGRAQGEWAIDDATNRDWETIAAGPCVGDDLSSGDCLYIGEVGDNGAQRPSVRIYRVAEPRAVGGTFGTLPSRVLHFEYEGGPRDVEASYMGADGTLYLISKRALKDSAGRFRPALVFTIPPDAWTEGAERYVAAVADSLPIVPGTALGRQVTGATLSRDGHAAAVRTYSQLYVFRADSSTGRIATHVPPSVCSIAGLEEKQGEGITWFGAAGEWLLTSEGRGEPLWMVRCPPPDGAR